MWAVTPLLGRAVAAWYALFGTMLLTFAVGLRRPFEGLIGYATLACWCVLLLALPVVHSGDVSRRGLVGRADGRAAGARGVRAAGGVAGAQVA